MQGQLLLGLMSRLPVMIDDSFCSTLKVLLIIYYKAKDYYARSRLL